MLSNCGLPECLLHPAHGGYGDDDDEDDHGDDGRGVGDGDNVDDASILRVG